MRCPEPVEGLFTIGYEGLSSEVYFQKLLAHQVKLLCDVRKNAISRKKGFSKSALRESALSRGIDYIHLRDLGIDSQQRKNLKTPQDYNKLLNQYEKRILHHQQADINHIFELLNQYHCIALTCFESHYTLCHRGRVAKLVVTLNPDIQVEHL